MKKKNSSMDCSMRIYWIFFIFFFCLGTKLIGQRCSQLRCSCSTPSSPRFLPPLAHYLIGLRKLFQKTLPSGNMKQTTHSFRLDPNHGGHRDMGCRSIDVNMYTLYCIYMYRITVRYRNSCLICTSPRANVDSSISVYGIGLHSF